MLGNGVPWDNLLTSQAGLRDGIVSILMYDSTIFENFTVPTGLDKDTAIDYILSRAGKTPLAHPNPDYMKYYIGTWSTVRNPIWEKLYASTQFEYNPIYNTDRTTEITDSRQIQRGKEEEQTDSGTSQTTGSTTDTGTAESLVSAENASTYQPDRQEVRDLESKNTQNTTISTTQNSSENENTKETYTHNEHSEGNIGVTTTQQMIQEERDIVNFSVYDVIVRDFVEQFCLFVW